MFKKRALSKNKIDKVRFFRFFFVPLQLKISVYNERNNNKTRIFI